MKSLIVTIKMKRFEHLFPVVLIMMLYNVFLAFEAVDENSYIRRTIYMIPTE